MIRFYIDGTTGQKDGTEVTNRGVKPLPLGMGI